MTVYERCIYGGGWGGGEEGITSRKGAWQKTTNATALSSPTPLTPFLPSLPNPLN